MSRKSLATSVNHQSVLDSVTDVIEHKDFSPTTPRPTVIKIVKRLYELAKTKKMLLLIPYMITTALSSSVA